MSVPGSQFCLTFRHFFFWMTTTTVGPHLILYEKGFLDTIERVAYADCVVAPVIVEEEAGPTLTTSHRNLESLVTDTVLDTRAVTLVTWSIFGKWLGNNFIPLLMYP